MLFQLSSEIDFDNRVQPVCIAAQDRPQSGGWVSGWRYIFPGIRETNMTQWHIDKLEVLPSAPFGYYTLQDHEGIVS